MADQTPGVNMMVNDLQTLSGGLQQHAAAIRPPWEIRAVIGEMRPSNFGESLLLKSALENSYNGHENFTTLMAEGVSHNASFVGDLAKAIGGVDHNGRDDVMTIMRNFDAAKPDVNRINSDARPVSSPLVQGPQGQPPALLDNNADDDNPFGKPITGPQPSYWQPDEEYQHPTHHDSGSS